ncbi:hypothetical protein BH23CHL2_BH23CHL2_11980 [soil metagenome]
MATVKASGDGAVVPHPHFEQYAVHPTGEFGVSRVYRTGEAAVHPEVECEAILDVVFPAPLREAIQSADMRSAMFVPLKVRGRAIGAIAFAYSESGRRYSEADLPFAEELANRAAIAIDNARLHHDLEQSEERFRTLVEQIPAVVFTTNTDDLSRPTYMSPHIELMTGYSADQLMQGKPSWYEILHPEDREFVVSSDESIVESGSARTLEYRMITRDGQTIWVREEARLIEDESGGPQNWQGIISDVTLQKELESQLTHQAFHDTLTGLPNRALFNDRVSHARERRSRHGESIAVCFMDLDNFKVINDSLGHSVGDELLIQVARRLQKCRRSEDTAARFGGDEFAFLIEGISDTSDAIGIVSRIAESFDGPFVVGGRELFVTPSIGLSIARPDELGHRDLLREADAAMYKAKRSGKDRFELYTPTLTTDAVNRLDIGSDLRKTLDGEQMEMHYQPITELSTGRVVGVEALVRWNHPEHGLIPPDRFIPIAEETAMIVDLGRWILKESCRQVHTWNEQRDQLSPLRLSVNLSARQFSDARLVDDVQRTLEDTGFDPALLCLEITETVMMENEDAAAQMLRRLTGLGVRIAVDDFGTGYSSLSSLRRFTVDQLKIDQSFVEGLINDPHDSIIVFGVIGLAHALELEVIAEGVETIDQRDQLVALNCDLAQGYLFSRPLDSAMFESLYITPEPSPGIDIQLPTRIDTSEARPSVDIIGS